MRAGRVARASRERAGSATGGMGAGGGGMGGGGFTLTVNNYIQANSGEDLDALAEKTSLRAAVTVRRELERCFGMNLQMGNA